MCNRFRFLVVRLGPLALLSPLSSAQSNADGTKTEAKEICSVEPGAPSQLAKVRDGRHIQMCLAGLTSAVNMERTMLV
jgi:hypothetical protein